MKKTINLGDFTLSVEVTENRTPSCSCGSAWQRPVAQPRRDTTRGGEGIMVAVQKPQREFYDCGWRGEQTFQDHSRKYRNLENAAKACNWPNDLIDNGQMPWPVPQTAVATRQTVTRHPVGCTCPSCRPTTTRKEVRQKFGIVPCGAVVVDHTWDGEPIFRI